MKYKITESQYNRIVNELREEKRRFRGSIYVNLFVPKSDDMEKDKEEAKRQLEEIQEQIPNSYVGGIGHFPTGEYPNPEEIDKI